MVTGVIVYSYGQSSSPFHGNEKHMHTYTSCLIFMLLVQVLSTHSPFVKRMHVHFHINLTVPMPTFLALVLLVRVGSVK